MDGKLKKTSSSRLEFVMMKSCTAQFGQTIPCMVSTLTLGIFVELNKKMCLKMCFISKKIINHLTDSVFFELLTAFDKLILMDKCFQRQGPSKTIIQVKIIVFRN